MAIDTGRAWSSPLRLRSSMQGCNTARRPASDRVRGESPRGSQGRLGRSMNSFHRCGLAHPIEGRCSARPYAEPDECQPENHPTAEVDGPDRHAGHEAAHEDGDRDVSRGETRPNARHSVHDPTDAEQHEAGYAPDDQPAPDEV